MIFDLSKDHDLKSFLVKSEYFIEKGFVIDMTKPNNKRTIAQNAYLHAMFQFYGTLVGSTLKEAKTDVKRACPFGLYEKNGTKYLVETSKMDTKEMTDFIDWFRNYAGQNGYYLPTADEFKENHLFYKQEIERHKQYL